MPLGQFLDIEAATKGPALTSDYDDAGLATARQVINGVDEVLYPGPIGGIQCLWAVEAQASQGTI